MGEVASIIKRLNQARHRLESAASAVPAELWQTPPRPGAWSAAEVVAHLTMVEGAIADGAARLVNGPARPVQVWKRFHLPVWLAEWRVVRRETPIPLDRRLLADKAAMLARLAERRNRTLALLEEHRDRELSAYRWKHPFFGSLNYYSWFRVVAHHEVRHSKQLLEIVQSFQK